MEYKYIKNTQGRVCLELNYPPEGWKEAKNASTAPKGYKWYWNGKSLFSKEYESALIKTELLKDNKISSQMDVKNK